MAEVRLGRGRDIPVLDAVQLVKKWCGPSGQNVDGRCSDSYWIEVFGEGDIRLSDIGHFLNIFRLDRGVIWDTNTVIDIVMRLRGTSFAPAIDVQRLVEDLSKCVTKKNSSSYTPMSAASKIANFARPKEEVFIFDGNAERSLSKRMQRRRSFKYENYGDFHKDYTDEFDKEQSRPS